MPDREKVIEELKELRSHFRAMAGIASSEEGKLNHMESARTIEDAIILLKKQETSLKKVAADYGLTVDGVSFALDQYQTVISEITHGRMSKLSYYARDILSVANDVQCNGCELKEAQEPIRPNEIRHGDVLMYYQCPACTSALRAVDRYCSQCGRKVKWE